VNYPFKVNNNEKSVKSDAVKRDFSKPFFFFKPSGANSLLLSLGSGFIWTKISN